jgi:hypothetical protein
VGCSQATTGNRKLVGCKQPTVDLVIPDELGHLPCPQSGRQLLFHLLSKLYEQTSHDLREG